MKDLKTALNIIDKNNVNTQNVHEIYKVILEEVKHLTLQHETLEIINKIDKKVLPDSKNETLKRELRERIFLIEKIRKDFKQNYSYLLI